MFTFNLPDLTKREWTVLLILVIPTVLLGVYPAPILDAVHYSVSTLLYAFDISPYKCDDGDTALEWAKIFAGEPQEQYVPNKFY